MVRVINPGYMGTLLECVHVDFILVDFILDFKFLFTSRSFVVFYFYTNFIFHSECVHGDFTLVDFILDVKFLFVLRSIVIFYFYTSFIFHFD